MPSMGMWFAIIAVCAIVIFALVRAAQGAGAAKSERNTLRAGEEKRNAFDEVMARPVASGRKLIDQLRNRVGR